MSGTHWISVEEAARRLGMQPDTIWRKLRDRVLTGRKIGNRWQVREQSVEAYANANVTRGLY